MFIVVYLLLSIVFVFMYLSAIYLFVLLYLSGLGQSASFWPFIYFYIYIFKTFLKPFYVSARRTHSTGLAAISHQKS